MGLERHYKYCETLPRLFSDVPVMVLMATATIEVTHKLSTALNHLIIVQSLMNRPDIFLAVYIYAGGRSIISFSLDHRDLNEFADRVSSMVKNESSIVYTDFATHVGPIVLALSDRGVNATLVITEK